MKLDELRKEINTIDEQIMDLFKQRMSVSKKIGEFKKQNNLPILDSKREASMFDVYKKLFDNDDLWNHYRKVLETLMNVSKEYQNE
ncbi:MAG TPA: chorismate mutase [Acholeplasma sp.]|jgi:monofunctional chorismate mutase|nr:chorismate mutase [Acholeplasma sp.]